MASSRNSAPEKKSEEKPKKRPTISKPKTHTKRNNDNKSKTSNGVASDAEALAVVRSSSSDSDHGAENGFMIIQSPIFKGKRELGERESPSTAKFPMERVRRIIRSEDSDMRITSEAVHIVNKATEKFLERFCGEAYACCVHDRKKSLAYKHLSSAVNKRNRYDFLSDFVPVKVKAKDALAEIKSMEPGSA